jgi:3-deoxy-D-manno-octulosonic-acid transferase
VLQGFLTRVLNDATLFLMQSEADASRVRALGAPEESVIVTGNLKYDLAEPPPNPLSDWLKEELSKADRRPVIVAGSVLADEEMPILRAFAEIEREFPNALLILAPRRPEQFNNAAEIIMLAGRPLVRRREVSLNGAGNRVLAQPGSAFLLDSLGELAGIYRLADAVFVGGSMVPGGGHNILEPAAFSKVPVYGPYMDNFREIAGNFSEAGASIQVSSSGALASAWVGLLKDPERAARMGACARELVDRNRGATNRVLERLADVIDAPRRQT